MQTHTHRHTHSYLGNNNQHCGGQHTHTHTLTHSHTLSHSHSHTHTLTLTHTHTHTCSYITSLAGRRICSAGAAQALKEGRDGNKKSQALHQPPRLPPATAAKLMAELLAEQVTWWG